MTFEEKLAAVIATMTGPPSFLPAEDLYYANIKLDDQAFPVIMILPNGLGNINIKTQVTRTSQVALWFAERIEMDVAYSEKRAAWERMHLLAAEFIAKVGISQYFFAPTEITFDEAFDRFDVNVCGVIYYMKIQERSGFNVCELQRTPDPFLPVISSVDSEILTDSSFRVTVFVVTGGLPTQMSIEHSNGISPELVVELPISTITSNSTVSIDILGLTAGRTYHFRIGAINIHGVVYSAIYTVTL